MSAGSIPEVYDKYLLLPHGYHDGAMIRRDLSQGGFSSDPRMEIVTARSRAASARIPAVAFCHWTALRTGIEARNPAKLRAATDAAEAAIAARYGHAAVDGKIQPCVSAVKR